MARRKAIAFHKPSEEPRPILQRIWRLVRALGSAGSRNFAQTPRSFSMPCPNGCASGLFNGIWDQPRDGLSATRLIDRFPLHLGTTIQGASLKNSHVNLRFTERDSRATELRLDHIIGATGFRVAISRLKFLDEDMRRQIRAVDDTPVLSRNFETSIPDLYMVGVASANCFGPLTRFAYRGEIHCKAPFSSSGSNKLSIVNTGDHAVRPYFTKNVASPHAQSPRRRLSGQNAVHSVPGVQTVLGRARAIPYVFVAQYRRGRASMRALFRCRRRRMRLTVARLRPSCCTTRPPA